MREAMLRLLQLLAQTQEDTDRLVATTVQEARGHGASWEEIAQALQLDPTTVQERYGGRTQTEGLREAERPT